MSVDERQVRAEKRRRAGMFGEVIRTDSEPAKVAADTPEARFAQLTALVARLFAVSGDERAKIPRSQYPGEVFETSYGS